MGDELMAVGQAEVIHKATGSKVAIGRSVKSLVHSAMELYCPWVVQPGENPKGSELLKNYPGNRPYINYRACTGVRQVCHKRHRAVAGKLFFSEDENAESYHAIDGFEKGVILAPHIKGTFSGPNKAWPLRYWHVLVDMIQGSGRKVIHMGPPSKPSLVGVDLDLRVGIRQNLAVMRWAGAVVTSEGLIHHAAAGMNLPAVVLWGERTDPRILGYAGQENLVNIISGDWCGKTRFCSHCEESMEGIHPESVFAALERTLS